jgi:hypothetical protein
MIVVIRLSKRAELKALPILFRHSAGFMLPNRTYVIGVEAARALAAAGVLFTELCRGFPGRNMNLSGLKPPAARRRAKAANRE